MRCVVRRFPSARRFAFPSMILRVKENGGASAVERTNSRAALGVLTVNRPKRWAAHGEIQGIILTPVFRMKLTAIGRGTKNKVMIGFRRSSQPIEHSRTRLSGQRRSVQAVLSMSWTVDNPFPTNGEEIGGSLSAHARYRTKIQRTLLCPSFPSSLQIRLRQQDDSHDNHMSVGFRSPVDTDPPARPS